MGDLTKLDDVLARASKFADAVDALAADRDEQRERTHQSFARLDASGCRVDDEVRAALADPTLIAISHTQAERAAEDWLSRGAKREAVLVLSGPSGCGKTVALALVCFTHTARYVTAENVCRVFSANFGEQLEVQQHIRDAPLLAIDDVGTETDDRRMLSVLLDVLDARPSASRTPTLITTNLTKKAFAERYPNERLISRMARVRWEAVGGEDLRRRK